MPKTTRSTITVRYAETDAQGIVHHSNYLVWFEVGRSDFLRQNGLNYTDFEKSGIYIVVAKASTRYRSPAYFEDVLTLETTLEQIRGKMLEFNYKVLRGEELLAEGGTTHIILNAERKPSLLPAEMKRALLDAIG